MPNHETNNVVIIGAPDNIRRFVNEALAPYPFAEGESHETHPGRPEKILDFNRIMPMPDELQHTVSPHTIAATQAEADQMNAEYNAQPFSKMMRGDDDIPQIKYLTMEEVERRIAEYGAIDWYAWSTSHWGTKWNCYSHSHYELRWLREYSRTGEGEVYGRVDLRFETAWSQPTPIFEAIELAFDVKVHCVTQDEGGFPDVEYGDPYDNELISKVITFEFDTYDTVVDEPKVEAL